MLNSQTSDDVWFLLVLLSTTHAADSHDQQEEEDDLSSVSVTHSEPFQLHGIHNTHTKHLHNHTNTQHSTVLLTHNPSTHITTQIHNANTQQYAHTYTQS